MVNADFTHTLRLTENEIRQLLWQTAKGAQQHSAGASNRESDRIYRQIASVPVALRVGEEAFETYRAPLLDLSATGAGFIFGRFVHPGANVKVGLIKLDKDVQVVAGTTRWCKLLRAPLHRVGVAWDSPIDIEKFSLDVAVEQAFENTKAA